MQRTRMYALAPLIKFYIHQCVSPTQCCLLHSASLQETSDRDELAQLVDLNIIHSGTGRLQLISIACLSAIGEKQSWSAAIMAAIHACTQAKGQQLQQGNSV